MRVCTTGCASAEEEGPWEAGVQEGFMGKKVGRVEDRVGQGLSPFFSGSKPLGAAPQLLHVRAYMCTHRGWQGQEPWGVT